MDFVRKNLGFVIFSVVGAVLLITLFILNRGAAAKLAEVREKSDEQQEFIREVSRGKYALNTTNVNRAQQNQEIAETELNDFLAELEQKYTYKPPEEARMPGGVECLGKVRKTVRKLSSILEQRGIQTAQEQYFSFNELAKSSYPPPQAQVPIILKQLDLATLVVQAAANSFVSEFHSLERLDTPGREPENRRGGFQSALYRVSVSGNGERIRSFINNLNKLEQMLLLIKRCEISREKQTLQRPAPMKPGEPSRNTRERPRGQMREVPYELPPDQPPPPNEMNGTTTQPEPAVISREQRQVFEPMPLRATITFGLLDFRMPDNKANN